MELSKRLQGIISLMPPAETVCDVGCDHGYVAISFIQKGIAKKVIAMDVNPGPLEQAKRNAALYGVTEQLDFRLADGLDKVSPGEAQAFVCAGMGGRLLVHIMSEGRQVMEQMHGAVVQPQSELRLVREYIYRSGWHISKEDMVFEAEDADIGEGKYYPMMYIEPGAVPMPEEAALIYGPLLLEQRHPVLMQYLEFSLKHKEALISKLEQAGLSKQAESRLKELANEAAMVREILAG